VTETEATNNREKKRNKEPKPKSNNTGEKPIWKHHPPWPKPNDEETKKPEASAEEGTHEGNETNGRQEKRGFDQPQRGDAVVRPKAAKHHRRRCYIVKVMFGLERDLKIWIWRLLLERGGSGSFRERVGQWFFKKWFLYPATRLNCYFWEREKIKERYNLQVIF
jgi:hypothetical protein